MAALKGKEQGGTKCWPWICHLLSEFSHLSGKFPTGRFLPALSSFETQCLFLKLLSLFLPPSCTTLMILTCSGPTWVCLTRVLTLSLLLEACFSD